MSATEPTLASEQSRTTRRNLWKTALEVFLRAGRRWRLNRAAAELSRLDDRQLEDIGISRNDIPKVVEGLFNAREAQALPLADKTEERPVAAEAYPRAA